MLFLLNYDSRKDPVLSCTIPHLHCHTLLIYRLHAKWVYLLKGLSKTDFEKSFIHPSNNEKVTLKENTGIYAWHCQHHFAHIEQLLIRKNWV